MPLPVGAVNSAIPIPFAPPINAAQSPARATQHSSAQMVTRSDMDDRDLSIFDTINDWSELDGTPAELAKLLHKEMCRKSEEIKAWDLVMAGGNPEGKTLRDLTMLLISLFQDAKKDGCRRIFLTSDRGQMKLERTFDGRVITYANVANNYCEFKKEDHARINDELTLSVLRALYRESTVNNFLDVKHGMALPVGAVNNAIPIPSAPPISTAQSSARTMRNSRGNTVTSDDVSERRLAAFTVPDKGGELIRIDASSALLGMWDSAMLGGNPERITLRNLTFTLTEFFLEASVKRCHKFLLEKCHELPSSVYRRIVMSRELDGCVKTRAFVRHDRSTREVKEKMYAQINDELTLSVLRALYKESTVNDFLGIENNCLPATATQNSSVRMITIDDMSARSSSTFISADECVRPDITFAKLNGLLAVEMNNSSALLDAWERAMVGGNPEGKTLQDLTLMLKLDLRDKVHGGHELALCNDRGQVKIGRRFWGGIKTYTHVANNNYNEFKKEKYARINDELTLSVLRVLYKESIVNNFLGVRNEMITCRCS